MKSRKRRIRIIKHSHNPNGFIGKFEMFDETYKKIYSFKFPLRDDRAIYDVLRALEGIIDTSIVGIIKKYSSSRGEFW